MQQQRSRPACPTSIAVNEVTNKTYVANYGKVCLISNTCINAGSVTVIDGATNSATELQLPQPNLPHPVRVALNANTNKIYVANQFSSDVIVIDGNANAVTTSSTASFPYDIAVNLATNRIYVASFSELAVGTSQTVTVIDGTTDATAPINDSKASDRLQSQ